MKERYKVYCWKPDNKGNLIKTTLHIADTRLEAEKVVLEYGNQSILASIEVI